MADKLETIELPLLPLRDVVVYPHMVIPLFVGRDKSIRALEAAMAGDKQVLLVAQKSAVVDDPGKDDVHGVGTVSNILQLLRLPDGTVKVLVEGGYRAELVRVTDNPDYLAGLTRELPGEAVDQREADALVRSALSQFEKYVNLGKKIPSEVLTSLSGIEEPGRLADTIAAHMTMDLDQKQAVLEISDVRERLEHLMAQMESEMDVLQVEKRIRGRVKKQMEKSQREYYLNEQMKAIQKELGELDENTPNESDELEKKIQQAGMTKEAEDKVRAELG